jgi:hypothetical protein
MLRHLARLFSRLGKTFAPPCDRSRLRTLLGVTPLEDRTVPAAIPLTGPNGGEWVKVDTLTVATRTHQTAATGVTSAIALEAGTTYLAVASGTARIATDATGFADAEFIRYNKSTGPQDGSSPGYAWNNHGVRLAGVDGGTTTGNLWGTYQSDHTYVREFVGQGTTVTGYYSDIPGYYGDNSGTLTVDLYAEVPVVSVTAADTGEGSATGGFTFTRTGDLSGPLTLTYSVGGTATPGADYTPLTGTVTFAAGQYRVEVPVEAFGDNTVDDGETVTVTIETGTGYALDTAATTATVVINDQALTVSVVGAADAEEGVGNGAFTISRAGDLSQELDIPFSVFGTAEAGVDYTALTGTSIHDPYHGVASFPAGVSSINLIVQATIDGATESTELVAIIITPPDGYTAHHLVAVINIDDTPNAAQDVVFDLDVNANGQLGDPGDGAATYLPGYYGVTPRVSSAGTYNGDQFQGQRMKLILDGIGTQTTPDIDKVLFVITSTSAHGGYASNRSSVLVEGEGDGDGRAEDYSFRHNRDWRSIEIDTSSSESEIEGGLYGGRMDATSTWVDFYAKDFGGAATVEAWIYTRTADGGSIRSRIIPLAVPRDDDGDGLSDRWEQEMYKRWIIQYQKKIDFTLALFSPSDDNELLDPDGAGDVLPHEEEGDAHTVLEEYRGYVLDGGGTDGDGQNTHAGGHIRLDPARKELLVEIDRDKKIDSLPEGGLRGVMNGSAAMFSKNQGGAGIYMYYLFDEVELALRLRDVVNAEDQVKTLGAHRDTTSARETGNSALASDFVHLLVVNNAGSLEGAWAWDRGTNPPTPLVSRGVLLAVADLVFLHRDFLPNEAFSEVLISTVTHELTHLLIDRHGAKFFTKGEHTTDPHGTGVIDDVAKSDIMYTDIEKRGNSKARFLSVVQSAIRVRSNDGLVE